MLHLHSTFSLLLAISCVLSCAHGQTSTTIIKASGTHAEIEDGEYVRIGWHLNPQLKSNTYYVNVPRSGSHVTFRTDQEEISFNTKFGKTDEFVVIVDGKDRCVIRIAAEYGPSFVPPKSQNSPSVIPFELRGSRIYLKGLLNDMDHVDIQFDLGAGTSCVNAQFSEKLGLKFDSNTTVDNSQGVSEARVSSRNSLAIEGLNWTDLPLTEVGNMRPDEALIIGNSLFRDSIIEIDYDKKQILIHDQLPLKAQGFKKQPVYYEQDRPKFQAELTHEGVTHRFWCLFDTGRDGTMQIGDDFTRLDNNWSELRELQVINGKKIVKLNALIAGQSFKDIVTNAADPALSNGRTTLFGNQILNQFNCVLDNREGLLYLSPNSRLGQGYSDYTKYLDEIRIK